MFFDDTWSVRTHNPVGSDWTHGSYAMISSLSCVDDFWTMWNSIQEYVPRTMVYVTREHVFPSWDDPSCINGCTVSYIVRLNDANSAFRDLVQSALAETLVRDGDTDRDMVNGVSIAPKKGFNVVKIWMKPPEPPVLRLPKCMRDVEAKVQTCRGAISSLTR